MDPGTDLEDELPTPAASPVTVDHGDAPRPTQVDVDGDLDQRSRTLIGVPGRCYPARDGDPPPPPPPMRFLVRRW